METSTFFFALFFHLTISQYPPIYLTPNSTDHPGAAVDDGRDSSWTEMLHDEISINDVGPNQDWKIHANEHYGFIMGVWCSPFMQWHVNQINNPNPSQLTIRINGNNGQQNSNTLIFTFSIIDTIQWKELWWSFAIDMSNNQPNKIYPRCNNDTLPNGDILDIMNDDDSSLSRMEKAANNNAWNSITGAANFSNKWDIIFNIAYVPDQNKIMFSYINTLMIKQKEKPQACFFDEVHPDGNFTMYMTTDDTAQFSINSIVLEFGVDDPTNSTPPPHLPTNYPFYFPTLSTQNPTSAPSSPTIQPTPSPTMQPTPSPTEQPTLAPTENPTPTPTDNPTPSPTQNPTNQPTPSPTQHPIDPATSTSEPTISESTTSESTTSEPTASIPITSESTTSEATTSESTTSESTTSRPTTSEPTTSIPTISVETTGLTTTSQASTTISTPTTTSISTPTTTKPTDNTISTAIITSSTDVAGSTAMSTSTANRAVTQKNAAETPVDNSSIFEDEQFIFLAIIVLVFVLLVIMCVLWRLSRSRNKLQAHPSRFEIQLSFHGDNTQPMQPMHVPNMSPVELEEEITDKHGLMDNEDSLELDGPNTFGNRSNNANSTDLTGIVTPGNLIDKDIKDMDVDNINVDGNDIMRKHKETDGGDGNKSVDVDDIQNGANDDVVIRKHKETDGGDHDFDNKLKSVDVDQIGNDNYNDGDIKTGGKVNSPQNKLMTVPSIKKINSKAEGHNNDYNTLQEGDVKI